jgi:hypothetical protein
LLPHAEKFVKQLKVSLPDAVRDQITAAADKSGHSLSEEIRQRLERTIEQDADPITTELLRAIIDLAADVQANYGMPWHAYGEVLDIFAAAVTRHIHDYRPGPQGGFEDLFRARFGELAASQLKEAAAVLGATLAHANQRIHSYEHLRRLQIERQRQLTIELASGPTTLLHETRKKEEEKKKGGKS